MWLVNEVNEGTKDGKLLNDIFIGRIKPRAEFEPTSPWLLVGCDYRYIACTQAVGWSKKPEFVMRWPFWIRAARSGPGWGLTKRARGGRREEGRKTACPKTSSPWVAQFRGVRRWTLSPGWSTFCQSTQDSIFRSFTALVIFHKQNG